MRLADLCDFQTGFTVRGRLEPSLGEGLLALQLRDLKDDGTIDMDGVQRFDLEGQLDRYLLQAGDLVFRSRGLPNLAYVVPPLDLGPVAALLPLIVLRPNHDRVMPEYLAWAINQPSAQRQIDAEAQGTNMRMIPKSSLEGILVPVPDLNTQRLIVAVTHLAARETALLHELADKRNIFTSRVLADFAQAGSDTKGL